MRLFALTPVPCQSNETCSTVDPTVIGYSDPTVIQWSYSRSETNAYIATVDEYDKKEYAILGPLLTRYGKRINDQKNNKPVFGSFTSAQILPI